MLDISLGRCSDITGEPRQIVVELATITVESGIEIAMRTTVMGQRVRPAATDGDLDFFHRIENEEAQAPIEVVQRGDRVEVRAWPEAEAGLTFGVLERQPVCAESIVADVLEPVFRPSDVRNYHPLLLQMGDLLSDGRCRLGERARHPRS